MHFIFVLRLTGNGLCFQVKSEWLYNAGAGVIAHVANCLKDQESRVSLTANL